MSPSLERPERSIAEQWLDVRFDPAAVHRQRGWLNGPSASAKDAASLGRGEIPVADLGGSDDLAEGFFLLGRIDTIGDLARRASTRRRGRTRADG